MINANAKPKELKIRTIGIKMINGQKSGFLHSAVSEGL